MTENKLAAALIKARANFTYAVKDKLNTHLKTKYADLEAVVTACEKALAEQGLVVVQSADFDANSAWVETQLIHAPSGETVKSRLPLVVSPDSQKTGSALTYNRRYSVALVAGVIVDDDDGAAMTKPPAKEAKPAGDGAKALAAATQAQPPVTEEILAKWVSDLKGAADLQTLNGLGKGVAKLNLTVEQRAICEAAYTESNKRLRAAQPQQGA